MALLHLGHLPIKTPPHAIVGVIRLTWLGGMVWHALDASASVRPHVGLGKLHHRSVESIEMNQRVAINEFQVRKASEGDVDPAEVAAVCDDVVKDGWEVVQVPLQAMIAVSVICMNKHFQGSDNFKALG
jgi:hypothetical protein